MAHHLRVRLAVLPALFLLLVAVQPAAAQAPGEVSLDSSPQLFSVLYALRAAGVAPSTAATDPFSASARIESSARQLPPEVVAPLKAFFAEQHPGQGPVDLSPYISLALVVSSPPAFQFTLPEDHVPPDAHTLAGFLPHLRSFYEQAGVAERWRQVQPFYEAAVARRRVEVADLLLTTRGYLRLIEASSLSRTYFIYLDWLAPPGLTSARNYGDYYYLVIHPEENGFLQAVRHQYLHFLLDPVATKFAEDLQPLARLQSIAERAPRLPRPFQQDTVLLATECLIRAVELRLQELEAAEVAARVNEQEKEGFLFVRHFYQALEGFEQDDPSIRFYFPELLRNFQEDQEVERLSKVEFAPAETSPATADPLPPTPEQQVAVLLAEAETLMAEGDYPAVRQRLQRVLDEFDPRHPRAFYGLALLASFEQDSERAKQYFQRTVEVAREPQILGWAHVYLGRIYDLEGDRRQAVRHYQAALDLQTRLARIEQAARSGLEHPFGEID